MYMQLMKRAGQFALVSAVLTVTMVISWSAGFLIGNAVTSSTTPAVSDSENVGQSFLIVCVLESIAVAAVLFVAPRRSKWWFAGAMALCIWTIQFVLTQLETWFFYVRIHMTQQTISYSQLTSIVIAGLVMSIAVAIVSGWLSSRLRREIEPLTENHVAITRQFLISVAIMAVIIYPSIYFCFGYWIAWSFADLRDFYGGHDGEHTFFYQLGSFFTHGTYLFQIFRALIWIGASLPLLRMMPQRRGMTVVTFGVFTAVIGSVQLLIPNPYMPAAVREAHLLEVSSSDLLWGILIAATWLRSRQQTHLPLVE